MYENIRAMISGLCNMIDGFSMIISLGFYRSNVSIRWYEWEFRKRISKNKG